VTPDILKPVPVSVAALTVSGDVPVDVNVTDCVAGVFSTTSPKATLVALRVSVVVPVPVAPVPVAPDPLKLIATFALDEELLVMVSCPVADPAAEGLNSTLKLNVAPAARVAGRLTELLSEKDVPVTATFET
jgi:hypothetical protein